MQCSLNQLANLIISIYLHAYFIIILLLFILNACFINSVLFLNIYKNEKKKILSKQKQIKEKTERRQ